MRWHYWTTLAPTVTILFGSCRHETHRLLLISYTNKVDCLQCRNSCWFPTCASSYLLIELSVVERLLQLHALALLFFKSAHTQAAGVRLADFLCRPHNILPTEHQSLNLQVTHRSITLRFFRYSVCSSDPFSKISNSGTVSVLPFFSTVVSL